MTEENIAVRLTAIFCSVTQTQTRTQLMRVWLEYESSGINLSVSIDLVCTTVTRPSLTGVSDFPYETRKFETLRTFDVIYPFNITVAVKTLTRRRICR